MTERAGQEFHDIGINLLSHLNPDGGVSTYLVYGCLLDQDGDGATPANLGRSERRAYTVRDYLINGGINEARLTARGCGGSQSVADHSTPEGKAQNRRVEFRILVNRE